MDLDETMTTSSASTPSALQDDGYEDDSLFPGSGGGGAGVNNDDDTDTPANDHLNAAAPGELSPPRSQTQSSEQELQTAGDEQSATTMIKLLVEGQEAVIRTARSVFPIADSAADEPTADLLTQRLQIHEKTAWMLRSLLEK